MVLASRLRGGFDDDAIDRGIGGTGVHISLTKRGRKI
jgi:hypothetical protein